MIALGLGLGFGARAGGGGAPTIVLSASSILESAAPGSTVGVLSVVNDAGPWTFAKTADPDSKFSVTGADLKLAAALDYETKTSHQVTIQADNGVDDPISRTFTIAVANVLEVTLNALTGTFTLPEDAAAGAVAGTISGKTSGSTLTLIDDAGGRVALSGLNIVRGTTELNYEDAASYSFTVRETHPDAASPRDTELTIAVEAAGAGAPSITGTPEEFATLTTDATNPQWQRGSGSLFYDIAGATSTGYTASYKDVGTALRVRDTVTAGVSSATSEVAAKAYFYDSFTEAGTGSASISGHQADIGGTWSAHPSGSGTGVSIDRDNDRAIGSASSGSNFFINSQVTVPARLRVTTKMQRTSGIAAFLIGYSDSALDGYRFYYDANWALQRYNAGAVASLHNTSFAGYDIGTGEFTLNLTFEDLPDRVRLRYAGPLHTLEPVQADDTDALRKPISGRYLGLGPRTGTYFDDFTAYEMDNAAVVSSDAIWTWYTDPRAIVHNSIDYVAHIDKAGTINLTKRASGTDTTVAVGVANSPVDDHNNAGLCVLPGGRLLVIYADHQDLVGTRYKVSTNALPDISSFSSERSIPKNSSSEVSYANPFILTDGVLRVFRRGEGLRGYEMCTATASSVEAGTETWAFTKIFNETHAYCKFDSNAANDRIYVLYGTGHPDRTDTALYGAYLDVSSGEVWKDLAGATITLPLSASNGTLVRSSGSGQPCNWTWATAVGADGQPRFLGTRYPSGQGASSTVFTNIEYWHYRWDGSQIVQTQIAANQKSLYAWQPYYAGGMCFDGNDPSILYISMLDADGFYQLGEYRLDEATSTLTKVRNVSSRAIAHNCRPFSPKGHGSETAVYFWRGRYTSYINYDTMLHRAGSV